MIEETFKKLLNKKPLDDKEKEYLKPFLQENIISEDYELNSKYKIGTIEIKKDFAMVHDLENSLKNVQVDIKDLKGAYDKDLVLLKRVFNPKSRFKAKVVKVLSVKESDLLVFKKGTSIYSLKDQIELNQIKSFKAYEDGQILVINSKTQELVKDIGNVSDPKVDQFISLTLYDELIRLEKDLEVSASMDDENEIKRRVDLTNLPFTTIDPASAKDHDDAIYYDKVNHTLYVAIADVSYFVKEDSELDKLALKKSTSIYLPHKVLPMLLPSLSEDMCSLKEGENRFSYVFKIELNEKNEVKNSELFEAIIKSHRKFSYGRIDRVLSGYYDQHSSVEKEIFDYLVPLYEVTKNIRGQRLKKGYDFRSVEQRLRLTREQELESITTESSTPSHQLIEECMLLANIEASKKVSSVGIYRIHDEPSLHSISKLVDNVNLLGIKVSVKESVHETITHIQSKARHSGLEDEINDLIIKSQSQAKYSSKNMGHFGLGFDSYSHFTSPIRRYSDLVLHRMLKSKKVPSGIDDICEHISNNERKVDQLVWDFEDRKYARWAKKNLNEEFKAKIVDIERGIAEFYKDMPGLRVYLDNYKGENLFSKIKVIIKSSDIISKKIFGSIKN